jgi:hypothetical protein
LADYSQKYKKGQFLSHLLGMVIASQFLVAGAAEHSIPYPKLPFNSAWLDLPLRLIALWLLLDRNWRTGRLKITPWEVLALGFPVLVGLAYPFSVMDESIGASTDGYKSFLGDMLRFYTVFILVREAHLRAGFNGRTMLNWVLAGLCGSASLAILQALNVGGIREWSLNFFDQNRGGMGQEGYRARGTAQHWNGFASQMIVGTLIAVSGINFRKLHWYEYGFAGLLISGLIVSTSRGGYVTLLVTAAAAGLFFLVTNRQRLGAGILAGLALTVLAAGAIVATAKLEFFEALVDPPKVDSDALGSWKYRMEQAERLIKVGMERPIFGTGPSERLYNNRKTEFYSSSSVQGALDVTYPLLFAMFGVMGIAYMLGIIGFFLRYITKAHAKHPYAMLAFCTGVALAVHSFSEMLLLSEVMYLVSIVAALAVTPFRTAVSTRQFASNTPGAARIAIRERPREVVA